jgi:hypothetical protein
MLFMCQGTIKAGLAADERQKVLRLFAGWKPPAGLEIKAHYVSAAGSDYVIVETTSAEALIEATAIWAPFVSYEVTPITAAQDAVGVIKRAEDSRRTLL